MESVSSPPRSFPRWTFGAPLALAAMTLLAYAPALRGGFLWDDEPAILNNPLLHSLGGLAAIWTTIGFIPNEVHWWPLTYSVFWLESILFGLNPFFFHLGNILLHAAVAIQIWRLMRRLAPASSCFIPFLAAALFALHPIHVEAAAWIVELKDLLATLLGLLAIGAYLRYEERPSRKAQVLVMLAMAAAMLAKSSAVAIPAAMALLALWRRGRLAREDAEAIAPAAIVAIGLAVIDWRIGGAIDPDPAVAPPLLARLAGAGEAFWFYAGKLVYPIRLSVIYAPFEIDTTSIAAWLPLFAAIAFTAILWTLRKRIGVGPLVCWLFYGIALGPTLGLLHFSFLDVSPAADRYQYLASIAPLAGLAVMLGRFCERLNRERRSAVVAAIAVGLALLGAQTARCAYLFSSQTLLFANAASIAPQSYFAWNNYAKGLLKDGRTDDARKALEQAFRFDPAKIESSGNLAYILMVLGRDAESAEHYRRGLAIASNNPDLNDGYAWLLAGSSDPKVRNVAEALKYAREANRLLPHPNGKYLDTLAVAQAAGGDFSGAIASERTAISLARAAGLNDYAAEMEARLKNYGAGRPYVRPAPGVDAAPK